MSEKLEEYLRKKFPGIGVNKKREIKRLLFEISRIEGLPHAEILPPQIKDFKRAKNILLKKRYPRSYGLCPKKSFYLPEVKTEPDAAFSAEREKTFRPEKIYFDEKSEKSGVFERASSLFPRAEFVRIKNLKEFIERNPGGSAYYSLRRKNLLILNENYDFFKKCPCAKGALRCGYSVLNLGFGCPLECSYCYLQQYQNFPGIILPSNLGDFIRKTLEWAKSLKKPARVGSGEFTDSLALDHITGFSAKMAGAFSKAENIIFEFKTKTSNIANLLKAPPSRNIIAAWSINPPETAKKEEIYAASPEERIKSAAACQKHGYPLAFHFDPVIYSENWEKKYAGVLNSLFAQINPAAVKWISLGTLRFNRNLKRIIENRFPGSGILEAEMILSFDGKLRYPDSVRTEIYKKMIRALEKAGIPRDRIYLCMEPTEIWKTSGLSPKNLFNLAD